MSKLTVEDLKRTIELLERPDPFVVRMEVSESGHRVLLEMLPLPNFDKLVYNWYHIIGGIPVSIPEERDFGNYQVKLVYSNGETKLMNLFRRDEIKWNTNATDV